MSKALIIILSVIEALAWLLFFAVSMGFVILAIF